MNEDVQKLFSQPTVDLLTAARILSIGKDAAYRAAKDGSLPTIKVGGRSKVPTAKLRDMLGLPAPQTPLAA